MADKLAEIKALEHHDSGAADWKRLDEQHPGAAKFADELQVMISADAARALLSIVEAAIRYTEDGGKVRLGQLEQAVEEFLKG